MRCGVRPVLGRTLLPTQANERAGAAEVVVGYDLWKNRFDGDPSIIGKTMQSTCILLPLFGVASQGFQGCQPD